MKAETLDFVLFVKSRLRFEKSVSSAEMLVRHTPGVCGGEACLGSTRIAVWMLEEARRKMDAGGGQAADEEEDETDEEGMLRRPSDDKVTG